jgi:hypothetical protein
MRYSWTSGYTKGELDSAQARYGLTFPPDLVALLLDRRPTQGWDWRTDDEGIRRALDHPLSGLQFDVEHGLWWPEWGERPETLAERTEIVTAAVASASRLIPLIGRRYLPEEPCEAMNPVFSVMQSDVIYYGANLADFFRRQFGAFRHGVGAMGPVKYIPFWSDLVARNGDGAFWRD